MISYFTCMYIWKLKITIDFYGIPLNDKKKQTTDSHNMDGSEGNYATGKSQY